MPRKKIGAERRGQILVGMLNSIAKHGLAHCTTSHVAEEAGVSRGILHYYFKNKDEMISALVAFLRDGNFLEFKSTMGQVADPRERLRESMRYPLRAFDLTEQSEISKALARAWIEFWAAASFHPEVKELILDLQRSLRKHYVELLEEGIAKGCFRSDVSPSRVATAILAAYEGLMLQWSFDPHNVDFAAQIDVLERVFTSYLLV